MTDQLPVDTESDKTTTELAKAVKEVAKTTSKAIEFTDESGLAAWVGRVIGQPIEAAAGLLTDPLVAFRNYRGIRLRARFEEFRADLDGKLIPAPPKIALPLINAATLEDDDHLQDLYARLLAVSTSDTHRTRVRASFVRKIEELDTHDARILECCYRSYRIAYELHKLQNPRFQYGPDGYSIFRKDIIAATQTDHKTYMGSIENLFNLGLLAPHIVRDKVSIPIHVEDEISEDVYTSYNHGSELVVVTHLGQAFVELCTDGNTAARTSEYVSEAKVRYDKSQARIRENARSSRDHER